MHVYRTCFEGTLSTMFPSLPSMLFINASAFTIRMCLNRSLNEQQDLHLPDAELSLDSKLHPTQNRSHPVTVEPPGFPQNTCQPPASFCNSYQVSYLYFSRCVVMTCWSVINAAIDSVVKCEIRCMGSIAIHQTHLAYN